MSDEIQKRDLWRYAETVIVYIVLWLILAIPIGRIIDTIIFQHEYGLYGPNLDPLGPGGYGVFSFVVWVFLTTFLIVPLLTSGIIRQIHKDPTIPPTPLRGQMRQAIQDLWELMKDAYPLAKTVTVATSIVIVIATGLFTVLGLLSSHSYLVPFQLQNNLFVPFLTANFLIIVLYAVQAHRGSSEAYDRQQHFTTAQQSINDYIDLVEKSREKEAST